MRIMMIHFKAFYASRTLVIAHDKIHQNLKKRLRFNMLKIQPRSKTLLVLIPTLCNEHLKINKNKRFINQQQNLNNY